MLTHTSTDRDHERAIRLMDEVRKGKYGLPYTSDYIFDETVTIALVRTGRHEKAVDAGKLILGAPEDKKPTFVKMVRVDEDHFNYAWSLFQQYTKRRLSFTDFTSVSLIKRMGIDYIASFDEEFDGIVNRIH